MIIPSISCKRLVQQAHSNGAYWMKIYSAHSLAGNFLSNGARPKSYKGALETRYILMLAVKSSEKSIMKRTARQKKLPARASMDLYWLARSLLSNERASWTGLM